MKKILGLAVTICMIFTLVIGASMTNCGSDNFAEAANYSKGYYKITSDVGLNMRGNASTSGKLLMTIPYKTTVKVTGVSNGWGKISYKSKIGWISLNYAKYLGKYLTGIYAIKSDTGLNMRGNASASGRLLMTIPYRIKVKVIAVRGAWGRVTYGGKTGWISLKYASCLSANTDKTVYNETNTSVIPGVKVETIDYTTLKLSWPRTMKAKGYYVYRSTSAAGKFSKVKTIFGRNRNSFVNRKLAKNTAYYYKVESFAKSTFKTRIKKKAAPAAACGFTGSQGAAIRKVSCTASRTALIKWSKPVYATKYILYRSTGKKGKYCKVGIYNLSKTSLKNKGLKNGKTYYYKIRTLRQIKGKNYYSDCSAEKAVKVKRIISIITASNLTKPKMLAAGSPFTLAGKVNSHFPISRIRVGIKKSNKKWIKGMNVTRYPGTKSYDVSNVDRAIIFDSLSSGSYYYVITAVDSCGYGKVVCNSSFKVKASAVSSKGYMWPCAGRITSYFTGPDYSKGHHIGIDIANCAGTPIKASKGGYVQIALKTGYYIGSYGYYIVILHRDGYSTCYAHCRKLLVKAGSTVKKGQKIAEMGSTGYSFGNHLHFEIRNTCGARVNPLKYLP